MSDKILALIRQTSGIQQSLIAGLIAYNQKRANPLLINFFDPSVAKGDPQTLSEHTKNAGGILAQVDSEEMDDLLKAVSLPVVNLAGTHESKHFPNYLFDHHSEAWLAYELFSDRGYRNFCYVGFKDEKWCCLRCDEFRRKLKERGIHLSTIWLSAEDAEQGRIADQLISWLPVQETPLALWACNNTVGSHVLEACSKAGILVPDEVAVLGVGNETSSEGTLIPGLSSILLEGKEAGYSAAQELDRIMSNASPTTLRYTYKIPAGGIRLSESTDAVVHDDPIVASAMRIIAKQACKGLHPSDVVDQISASRRCIERRFKEATGKCILQHIKHVQCQRAKWLLSSSRMTLAEIAEHCGYEYVEHFSITFKKITGMTPGAYRKLKARSVDQINILRR